MKKMKRDDVLVRTVTPGEGVLEGHDDRATMKRTQALSTKLRVEKMLGHQSEWVGIERALDDRDDELEEREDELDEADAELDRREDAQDERIRAQSGPTLRAEDQELAKAAAARTIEKVNQQLEGLPCEVDDCTGTITPDHVPASNGAAASCSECSGEFEWSTGE